MFLSSPVVPALTTQAPLAANCDIDSSSDVEYQKVQSQNVLPTVTSLTEIKEIEPVAKKNFIKPSCDENCVDKVLSTLLSGKRPADDEDVNISSAQAQLVADQLSNNPDQYSSWSPL